MKNLKNDEEQLYENCKPILNPEKSNTLSTLKETSFKKVNISFDILKINYIDYKIKEDFELNKVNNKKFLKIPNINFVKKLKDKKITEKNLLKQYENIKEFIILKICKNNVLLYLLKRKTILNIIKEIINSDKYRINIEKDILTEFIQNRNIRFNKNLYLIFVNVFGEIYLNKNKEKNSLPIANCMNSQSLKIIINDKWEIILIGFRGNFIKIFFFDYFPLEYFEYINFLNLEINLSFCEEKKYATILKIYLDINIINKIKKIIDIFSIFNEFFMNSNNIFFLIEKYYLYNILSFLKIIKISKYKLIEQKAVIYTAEQFELIDEYSIKIENEYKNESLFYKEYDSCY